MTQETTHTPEPWVMDYNRFGTPIVTGCNLKGAKEDLICILSCRILARAEVNAARIVACVNACEGMVDPAAEIAELKAQRDELLAALNVCAASLCTYGSHPIVEKQVNNAINKAKGGRP